MHDEFAPDFLSEEFLMDTVPQEDEDEVAGEEEEEVEDEDEVVDPTVTEEEE